MASTGTETSAGCRGQHAMRELATALTRRIPDAMVEQTTTSVDNDMRVMHAAIAFSYEQGSMTGRIYADASDGMAIRWLVPPTDRRPGDIAHATAATMIHEAA